MTPRIVSQPQPGFFTLRLVRGGPLVPARIWRPCVCTAVGGDDAAEHAWTDACDRYPPLAAEVCAPTKRDYTVDELWVYGRPIPEPEWRLLVDQHEWDRRYAPGAATQQPARPVNLREQRIW